MLPFADRIEALAAKHAETGKLLEKLRYYVWLEQNGMAWDTIKGIADMTEREKRYGKAGYHTRMDYRNAYSFLLTDGSTKLIHNVPFSADIIFNRLVDKP